MSKILRLPKSLNCNGSKYERVQRGKKSLIYMQIYHGVGIAYEVFRIKIRKPTTIKGVFVPTKERYPHNEAFGYWAKSVTSLERALQIFNEYEKS